MDWMKRNSRRSRAQPAAGSAFFAGLVEWSVASTERGTRNKRNENAAVLRFMLNPEMQLSHG